MKRHRQRGTIYTGAAESIKNSLIIFPAFCSFLFFLHFVAELVCFKYLDAW
ncbi:hypothetical protein LguiA_012282 [Lonicera macranthoides]